MCPERPWECEDIKRETEGRKPSDLEKAAETPLADPVAIGTGFLTGLFRGLLVKAGVGAIEGAAGGEVAATVHGAQRMADASRLGAEAVKDVIQNATRTGVQRDGAKVFVQEVGGRFNVVVQGERGVITNLKTISEKSLNRLATRYGWEF